MISATWGRPVGNTTLSNATTTLTDSPSTKGRGKVGGSRIIYYWLVAEDEIYLLTVYRKGVKDDLSRAERASWRKVVEEIKHG